VPAYSNSFDLETADTLGRDIISHYSKTINTWNAGSLSSLSSIEARRLGLRLKDAAAAPPWSLAS